MKHNKPSVVVLLAAYNGEQYIAEQLNTIIAQKGVKLSILISVDKSTDSTLMIAQDYESKYPDIVTVLPYGDKYGSAGQNFTRLLCDVDFSGYQYISFADQDDIWLPDKLQRAIVELEFNGVDGYSANVTAFWETGREALIKKDYKQVEFDYLFESPGPGCTFVFNRRLALSLKKHLLSKKDDLNKLWLHDWYCYSFARFNEFKWFIDSVPLMKYRQHSSNEVGANDGWASFKNRLKVILSGDGFSKVLTQAYFIGQSELEPIKLIKNRSRFSMFRLLFVSWKCRRQFSHKMMLSVACLLFIIIGCSYRDSE
ncbi:glycosyltransferase [Vibrio lentus]|uniref:glycosyltransferase n=1 Tax=Vibrio lentus TaxID=136468 RepID=UPI00178C96B4|nr:glycosyltransferase [Vibrio lentus]MDN3632443.1 glycosyltransferase [Vibrio lentus]